MPEMIFCTSPQAPFWSSYQFYSSTIIIYYPKEHSLRVSALNSNILNNGRVWLDIFGSVDSVVLFVVFLKQIMHNVKHGIF